MNQDRARRALCRPSVLVAAPPDPMRDSLCFLLSSVLEIEIVALADDCAALLRQATAHCLALILLDGNLTGAGTRAALARLAADCPTNRCIVLANSTRQRREALAAGADGALLKGYSALELLALVDRLGTERGTQE